MLMLSQRPGRFVFSLIITLPPFSLVLGLHQGRQFSRAGATLREPQLASMAPPKPYGRRRECQVETRVQKIEQDYG